MLILKNIYMDFQKGTVNEHRLFEDFSMEVEKGEFVSIIGSNGSGKSSLLNLISGSLSPDSGDIVINGKNVIKDRDFVRYRKMGRVFQDTLAGTAPSMTLFENLSMADNKGGSWNLKRGIKKDKKDYYKSLLKPLGLGLEEKLDDEISHFSGGQRQAVALIMSSLQTIDFLLLDEHTAALDPKSADIIMALTDKIIKNKGLTALMVTHNLRYALKYGNRLIMMHEGKIIMDCRGEEKEKLILDEILDKFYQISIEVGNSL